LNSRIDARNCDHGSQQGVANNSPKRFLIFPYAFPMAIIVFAIAGLLLINKGINCIDSRGDATFILGLL
jgi:hypothetical protein